MMRLPSHGTAANLRSVFAKWRRRFSFSNRDQAKRRIAPSDPVPFSSKKGKRLEKFFISCVAGMEDVRSMEVSPRMICFSLCRLPQKNWRILSLRQT